MNAIDVCKKIKERSHCHGLDDWIDQYLVSRFDKRNLKAVISENIVSENKWSRNNFVDDMEERGFHVDYQCEDRPCGQCYYAISIPQSVVK